MSEAWFFIIGLPVGGLAVYLFYLGHVRTLHEDLREAKRQ